MLPKLKTFTLPWKVYNISKLKQNIIFDLGKKSIWISWGKKND
jgi:hypothetical protein